MKLENKETKPQYAPFDWIMSLPVIRLLAPIYEWNRGFWIYCFLGFLSTVIDFVLAWLLVKIIPVATIANIISWCASTFASFVMFRYLYFDRTNNTFMNELMKFVPTRLFTLGVSSAGTLILVDILKFNFMLVKVILIPVSAILNYITSKLFVFKDSNKKTA